MAGLEDFTNRATDEPDVDVDIKDKIARERFKNYMLATLSLPEERGFPPNV